MNWILCTVPVIPIQLHHMVLNLQHVSKFVLYPIDLAEMPMNSLLFSTSDFANVWSAVNKKISYSHPVALVSWLYAHEVLVEWKLAELSCRYCSWLYIRQSYSFRSMSLLVDFKHWYASLCSWDWVVWFWCVDVVRVAGDCTVPADHPYLLVYFMHDQLILRYLICRASGARGGEIHNSLTIVNFGMKKIGDGEQRILQWPFIKLACIIRLLPSTRHRNRLQCFSTNL